MTLRKIAGLGALLSLALPGVALAAEEPVLNSGDTAWMLISTALVLLMTIPVWRCSTAAWCERRTCCRS